jgi:hypothetical protein
MTARTKTGPHRAVRAMARAARAWGVGVEGIVVDPRAEHPVTLAPPRPGLTRAQLVANTLVTLADEDGLDAALEAVERGLMGASVLPTSAKSRELLRELAAEVSVVAEELGLRGHDG